jgi:flagellar biosynthetic protein FliO
MDPVRYITALLLVGGLLALAIWMLRRFRFGNQSAARSALTITAHASLGAREKLVVVRFAGQDHLLGVTPSSISRIASADMDDSSREEHP